MKYKQVHEQVDAISDQPTAPSGELYWSFAAAKENHRRANVSLLGPLGLNHAVTPHLHSSSRRMSMPPCPSDVYRVRERSSTHTRTRSPGRGRSRGSIDRSWRPTLMDSSGPMGVDLATDTDDEADDEANSSSANEESSDDGLVTTKPWHKKYSRKRADPMDESTFDVDFSSSDTEKLARGERKVAVMEKDNWRPSS
ncbi:hypothetical protein LTS10_007687 [Elasticomyces elasticus]|nr:hypothetical protein LTS10_007687 [Elasticomyces elasticus]